ncbi:MAG: ribosomal RNA small subunit methyltransferase A [Dehalococcoidia bacterium]|jgi:16S rRNA (adenine1518-N6/adenine1519-N6)-dimethyltransferase|nr:16S rRNA (adenine(1518)-N(6)/adenine(1519)-N(6))-dimethyltransferase RsmA [Tepidiformaceae bacterium]
MPPARLPGPRPRKALGQHFLRDSGVLHDIAAAVAVPSGGIVLELGAGTGQLTAALLERGLRVVALEIEPRLVAHLRHRFRGEANLRIVEADARTADAASLVPPGTPFVVAGNLPYFAANPIIRHFLEGEPKPLSMVVMIQREVGREITAPAGNWSLLTISVRVYAEPSLLFDVPPEAFDPPPAVHSSVVRLDLRPVPLVPPDRNAAFFELVSKTFRNPRKQIHNSLARGVWLPPGSARQALATAGIEPSRRPETLDVGEWLHLLDACDEVRASA